MAHAERNGNGVLCARRCEEARKKLGNERREKKFTPSLLFTPSGVTARSHDLLCTSSGDRGLTAPRSAA